MYWHVQTGQVFAYKGATNQIDNTTDVEMTLLNRTASNPTGGFLTPDAFIVGDASDRCEFSSGGLKIFANNVLRVVIGDLT